MAKVTMTLTGMEGLQQALKTAPEAVKVGAADAVAKTSFAVAQRMRALVPVNTGRLKSLIASSSTGTNGRVGFSDIRAAYYWRFVEYGTTTVGARPFVRPAADAEADGYLARLRAVAQKLERDFSSGRLT